MVRLIPVLLCSLLALSCASGHREPYSGAEPVVRDLAGFDAPIWLVRIEAGRAMGFPIEQDVTMVILRTKDGLIQAPRWGLWCMKGSRRLSLTSWLRLRGIPKVYTVETPTHLRMEDRLLPHSTAFAALVFEIHARNT